MENQNRKSHPCPACGSFDILKPIFGGKEVAVSDKAQIRKLWLCETCGHVFEPPIHDIFYMIIIFILMIPSIAGLFMIPIGFLSTDRIASVVLILFGTQGILLGSSGFVFMQRKYLETHPNIFDLENRFFWWFVHRCFFFCALMATIIGALLVLFSFGKLWQGHGIIWFLMYACTVFCYLSYLALYIPCPDSLETQIHDSSVGKVEDVGHRTAKKLFFFGNVYMFPCLLVIVIVFFTETSWHKDPIHIKFFAVISICFMFLCGLRGAIRCFYGAFANNFYFRAGQGGISVRVIGKPELLSLKAFKITQVDLAWKHIAKCTSLCEESIHAQTIIPKKVAVKIEMSDGQEVELDVLQFAESHEELAEWIQQNRILQSN